MLFFPLPCSAEYFHYPYTFSLYIPDVFPCTFPLYCCYSFPIPNRCKLGCHLSLCFQLGHLSTVIKILYFHLVSYTIFYTIFSIFIFFHLYLLLYYYFYYYIFPYIYTISYISYALIYHIFSLSIYAIRSCSNM